MSPAIFEPAIPANERPHFTPYTARPPMSVLPYDTEVKIVFYVEAYSNTKVMFWK